MAFITDANTGGKLFNQFTEVTPVVASASDQYVTWAQELGVSPSVSLSYITDSDESGTYFDLGFVPTIEGLSPYIYHSTEGGFGFWFGDVTMSGTSGIQALTGSSALGQTTINRWFHRFPKVSSLILAIKSPTTDGRSENSKWNKNNNVAIFYTEIRKYNGTEGTVHIAMKVNGEFKTVDIVTSGLVDDKVKFQAMTFFEGVNDNTATDLDGGQTFDLSGVQHFKTEIALYKPGTVTRVDTGLPVESDVMVYSTTNNSLVGKTRSDALGNFNVLIPTNTPMYIISAESGYNSDIKDFPTGDVTPVDFEVSAIVPPAHTSSVTGNVSKLGAPFGVDVVCVTNKPVPNVVGYGKSDNVTGDFTIDTTPYTEEVMLYTAPDYGSGFTASAPVSIDHVIHPTVPNGYIYVASNAGTLGTSEPVWGTDEVVISGDVSLRKELLFSPLINGFIKPTVIPV